MEKATGIDAVIWDLGGVILRTHDRSGRHRWAQECGLATGELERLVFAGEMGIAASLGRASEDDVWQWVGVRLGLPQDKISRLRHDFWSGDRVDHDLVDHIRTLREERKTALLSNAWPEARSAVTGKWGMQDAFDVMIFSAEVQMLKPDRRIYKLALTQLALEPHQTVFIDDFEENVAAATELGMYTILFKDPASTLAQLDELLT